MKKASLSLQITLIFIGAFIFTSIILGVLITNRLEGVYEDNIYDKLEGEGKTLKQVEKIGEYNSADNIAYIRYKSQEKLYNTSNNINEYINHASIELLINKAVLQKENSIRYVNYINDKLIYYVILSYQGFFDVQKDDIIIIITDDKIKKEMARETTVQILIVSLIAFLLGYIIIILWVSKLIKDTKKISYFLNKMDDDRYKTKIEIKRKDEIGNLVDNIELMRKKIIKNEKQKQEIIQGVSHDLKTPIAIIQSYAEALKDDMCTKEEAINITTRECTRLNNKVTKLLHLTRLNYTDIQHNSYGNVNMRDLIEQLVKSYSYQTKAEIEVILEDVSFVGNKEAWIIVIENIMDNAIRYAKKSIEITLKQNRLTIFNDGSTIDNNRQNSIFNTFEKGKDGKFGLGLAIVKKIVERFGFSVSAINYKDGVIFEIVKSDN